MRPIFCIASVGSPRRYARLNAAEAEHKELLEQPDVADLPTVDDVVAIYRRNLLRLTESLESDVDHAGKALADLLGRITIEQRGDEVWAEMETRQEPLMLAAGAIPGLVAGVRKRI